MNAFAFYCESITDVKVTLHLAKIKLLFFKKFVSMHKKNSSYIFTCWTLF